MAASNSSSSSASSSSSSSPPRVVSLFSSSSPLNGVKLDRTNFLLWESMVFSLLVGNSLETHVDGTESAPPRTVPDAAGTGLIANPAYKAWFVHLVVGWLRSIMTPEIATQLLHCKTARDLWLEAKDLTCASVKSRVLLLKGELQHTRKDSLKMEEYLVKIKGLAAQLSLAGAPVSETDLIMHTLSGLDSEYTPVVAILVNSPDDLTWSYTHTALMNFETRLEQLSKFSSLSVQPSANVAQRGDSPNGQGRGQPPQNWRGGNQNSRGGRGGRGRGRGGNPTSNNSNSNTGSRPQCQLCGKTTLARVIYETIQSKFETSCFIANVRKECERNGLVYLQKELLSRLIRSKIEIHDSYEGVKTIKHLLRRRKVLIVLDDVSHIKQLENLVGREEWFGEGSKVIVTTRDIHLLRAHEEFKEYEVEMLNVDESLKLLCQKAFKSQNPKLGFLELSKKVVEYASGLPLALEVLGRFLCQRSECEWMDTLDRMKRNLHKDILETLRISYDDLEDEEYKTIFLDIACFFNLEKKVEVTQILENCGLHPIIGIQVLIEKSLLSYNKSSPTSSKEFLYMHDLLQELGKNIVMQESPNDVARRSRLWSLEDIDLVLKGNKGTKKIQSIVLKLHEPYQANWHPDCFSKMHNLILLYLSNVHLSRSLNSLPGGLKVLIWDEYALQTLPSIDQLYDLVHIQLRRSKIKQLWNGTMFLDRLKIINLSYSEALTEISDFSGIPNLESLLLECCINLVALHESLGQLKKLIKLNLKDCKNLVTLPRKLEMNCLEEFVLSGCSKLEKLPEFGENMKRLSMWDVSETNIKEIPSTIVSLMGLKTLSLHGCKSLALKSWSLSIFSENKFCSLKQLDLSFCNLHDGSLPHDLSGLSSLVELNLCGNEFVIPPSRCLYNLLNLERLELWGCFRLQSMPKLPPNLLVVDAVVVLP